MQALPQKTTDYIAEQFRAYYVRKAQGGMNFKDARAIIDYLSVSGPAPAPAGSGAIDPSKPHVTGTGGRTRPSPQRIERILDKYAIDEETVRWNEVFDGLIEQYRGRKNKKALKFVRLTFEHQFDQQRGYIYLKREDVCAKMHISEKTYNNYRLAILTAAAIWAVSKGCNIDT